MPTLDSRSEIISFHQAKGNLRCSPHQMKNATLGEDPLEREKTYYCQAYSSLGLLSYGQ